MLVDSNECGWHKNALILDITMRKAEAPLDVVKVQDWHTIKQ